MWLCLIVLARAKLLLLGGPRVLCICDSLQASIHPRAGVIEEQTGLRGAVVQVLASAFQVEACNCFNFNAVAAACGPVCASSGILACREVPRSGP